VEKSTGVASEEDDLQEKKRFSWSVSAANKKKREKGERGTEKGFPVTNQLRPKEKKKRVIGTIH